MARKLQVKRGAKANLPVLAQGEFGFCTDTGAEELHIGNGSKNIQIPMVSVYDGDISELTRPGIYRVGTHESLPEGLWYGQVLVMQGADSDTVCQIGMGYADGALYFRSGQRVSEGTYAWRNWGSAGGSGGNFVSKDGDTMNGVLNISNTDAYAGLQKMRNIDGDLFTFLFGVGNDTTRGASGSLRLTDPTGAVKGRVDMWENGELTYNAAGLGYIPIAKFATGSYTGTGKCGSSNKNSLTFDFVPKFFVVAEDGQVTAQYCGSFYWINGSSAGVSITTGSYSYAPFVSVNGNTISWYQNDSARYQMDISGKKYFYIALG